MTAISICHVTHGGTLDQIVQHFGEIAISWHNVINPIAKKIFFILFGMEFMWQITINKVFAGDVEKLWVFFFMRTVMCFFFAKHIINIELYKDILMYFIRLGSSLSGFNISIASNDFADITPSEIMSNFACLADAVHQNLDTDGFHFITTKIMLAILQVLLFGALITIAYAVMKVLMQAYLLLYAGFILTGFAGSTWTINYWYKYLQGIAYITIKLFLICIILGIMSHEIREWAISINNIQTLSDLSSLALNMFGTSTVIALTIQQIPDWMARMLATGIQTINDVKPNNIKFIK